MTGAPGPGSGGGRDASRPNEAPPRERAITPYLLPQQYPRSSNAVAILVLGILSVALGGCFGFLGIIAWVMANRELRDMEAGVRPPQQRGLVVAGRVCGIVGTCLFGLSVLFWALWLVLAGAAALCG